MSSGKGRANELKKILQRKVKTDSRNNCVNICLKIFSPNTLSKLTKHLPIQSSCLPKKFTPRVESNDERGTRGTICHSWVSQGSREQGLLSLSGLWAQHTYLHTQRKHSWTHSGLDLLTAPTHCTVSPHSQTRNQSHQQQHLYDFFTAKYFFLDAFYTCSWTFLQIFTKFLYLDIKQNVINWIE